MHKTIGLGVMLVRLVKICYINDVLFYIMDFLNLTVDRLHKYSLKNKIFALTRTNCSDRSEMVNILSGYEYSDLDRYILKHHLEIKTVIDAGANIGMFTLYVAKVLKIPAKFILIEPDIENLKLLKKNLIANDIAEYKIYEKALYKEETIIKFDNSLDFDSRRIDSDKGKTLIGTVTIESLLSENNLTRFDLLKMDIEGGEWDLLTKKNLEYFNRIKLIILEYHFNKINNDIQIIKDYFVNFQLFVSSSSTRSGVIYLLNAKHD
jgi:FkbM family methyltransferase